MYTTYNCIPCGILRSKLEIVLKFVTAFTTMSVLFSSIFRGTTACKNKDNLIMSLVKFNWKWIVAAVILKLANDLLTFVPPQILKRLIHYMLMEK